MKLSTVLKRMTVWYLAAINDERPDPCRCVYLRSAPGRGKTTVLASAPAMIGKQIGKNLGVVIISGPLLNPPDAVGYLIPTTTSEGRAESLYTDPFWFRTQEGKRLDEYDGGIIIVDEADKMDVDVKKAIGEAALSRRLGPHTLPPGWVVWMAGNRSKDRSGATKELDHLINRRREIDISDDFSSWEDWALTHGVAPIIVSFAKEYTNVVFNDEPPKEQGPFCTPRSLVMLGSYLQDLADANGGEIPTDVDTIEEAGGQIGHGAAGQLFNHLKLERELPKFADIVKDPKKVKVPEKPDARMLVCYNLAHRVDATTAAPVIEYVERLPKEFAVTFAKAACKRDFKLVMTPAFQKWALTNASLMAVIRQAD